jgi:hypothetical protein
MVSPYAEVRSRIQPGDVIAFGGHSPVSRLIRAATRSPISHVGIVRQTKVLTDTTDRIFVELVESTTLDGFSGVTTQRLSVRVATFPGEVWWLPLSVAARSRFDERAFWEWVYAQDGKPYDALQAIGSALDLLIPDQAEDLARLFCSELVAGALEAAGVLPALNASEITPADLVRLAIYDGVVQLSGEPAAIPRFNSFPIFPVAA